MALATVFAVVRPIHVAARKLALITYKHTDGPCGWEAKQVHEMRL